STAEERTRALQIIRQAESQPLAADEETKANRAWLVKFMMDAPDFTIVVCTDLLGPIDGQKTYPHAKALSVQAMWGQLAFLIEHPNVAPKDASVFAAGMTSALAAYRNILQAEPEAHFSYLDQVLEKGAIEEHVR